MGKAADAIREDDAHWATVSRLSHLIDESTRRRRRGRSRGTVDPVAGGDDQDRAPAGPARS